MKNYIITGSIGHISKPVVKGLIKEGKTVTVITSNPDKVKEIKALGAKTLVGSVQDAGFLKKAFQDADVVYTMIPPIWKTSNWRASQNEVAANYIEAIKTNGIKYVVNLSSTGAHMANGCGPVNAMHDFEQLLNAVDGLNVKHLRPSSFYYNLLNQIGMIKHAGILGANYGSEQKLVLVHTDDIAKVALDELLQLNFTKNSVRYIYSDVRTTGEIVSILGKAIGKDIPWVEFSDADQKQGMLKAGVSETHAEAFTEMGAAVREGKMQVEVLQHKPEAGSVKLEDFAKEFSVAYQAS